MADLSLSPNEAGKNPPDNLREDGKKQPKFRPKFKVKKSVILVAAAFITLVAVGLIVFFWQKPSGQKTTANSSLKTIDLGNNFSVIETGATYKAVTNKPNGNFKTGQAADTLLSGIGFNNSGGPLLFNHPGGIATDGQHLLLADRNNNRVLIWNKLPDSNVAPDLVLGQKDFTGNNPGQGLNQFDWPLGVATDGRHVLVADTYNNRILIWNSFPTKDDQPADLVINSSDVYFPWGLWTNGKKLIVTSTFGKEVLLWNTIPSQDNQRPDIIMNSQNFGTPRTVGSDGQHLVIGDHNVPGGQSGNYFWNGFPVTGREKYDFLMTAPSITSQAAMPQSPNQAPNSNPNPNNNPNPGQAPSPQPTAQSSPQPSTAGQAQAPTGGQPQPGTLPGQILWSPTFTSDGKLIALSDQQLVIWNSFPQSSSTPPDMAVGKDDPATVTPTQLSSEGDRYTFNGGDGSGVALAGNRLYLSLGNGNKIVGFNSLPTNPDQKPDFVIGSPDINTNTLATNYFIANPNPVSNGQSLFVASDFDSTLSVWKHLPDQSDAHPDLVYSVPDEPAAIALYQNNLALAGVKNVYLWKKLPTEPAAPDVIYSNGIGNVTFSQLSGVAMDDKYFYIADGQSNKIYVWDGIPDKTSNPKFTLSVNRPGRLSSDGQYLVVANTMISGTPSVFKIADLSDDAQPVSIGAGRFNIPIGVQVVSGKLIIADNTLSRVSIWNNIADAIANKNPDVVLGNTSNNDVRTFSPGIGQGQLFWPATPYFDGNYLWLGEYKFSGRLLRFSLQ